MMMEELKDDFQGKDLDNFIIKDNEYRKKKKIKYTLIISSILLAIITITIVLVLLLIYRGGKITSTYITKTDNEFVKLINENIYNKYKFSLKYNDESIDKTNNHSFSKAGKHVIVFEFKEKIESLENFFDGVDKLYEVDLSELNFENDIISTKRLFAGCENLKKIKLGFDTSKIQNTAEMLLNCKSIENLDFLDNYDFSNALNMSSMFSGCSSLSLEIISIKTEKVTDISKIFSGCSNLTSIKNIIISTSQVTNFSSIFENCENLIFINLSSLNTSNSLSFHNFFKGCESLTSIYFSNFDTSNALDLSGFFEDCISIKSIDLSKFDTSKVTDISGMFSNCEKLESIDLSRFNTESVVEMEELFLSCINLENINLDNFVFNKVEDMSYMFGNCIKIKEIKMGNSESTFENLKKMYGMFYGCTNLENFEMIGNEDDNNEKVMNNLEDMSLLFAECEKLKQFKFPKINTHKDINMNNMFLNCISIKNVDFSFSFSHINKKDNYASDMHSMFKNCRNLSSFNLSHLNLVKAYDFTEMFSGCISLKEIDLSDYDFSGAYYMDKMFYGCINMKVFRLPNKMTSLIQAKNIFENCENLNSSYLDISALTYSKGLMDISGMFKNCSSLEFITFPGIEVKYLINMDELFYGCKNLEIIKFNEFPADRLKSMQRAFYNCSSLKYLSIDQVEIHDEVNISDIFNGVNGLIVKYTESLLFNGLIQEIKKISNQTNT